MIRLHALLRTRAGFSVATASAMVLLRLVIFDGPALFALQAIPNHDMYQAAPHFATSMHSVRLSGELAWWNPVSSLGFAQYYEGFVAPLAPTWGHVVFIVWSQAVRALALAGIAIPEYVQYLTLNYVVLPFLAFGAITWFCSMLFERRAPAFLVVSSYALSGIGLWNSAWFYFQQSFDLFFLAGATVAVLQRPTSRRFLLLIAAVAVNLAAFNYWTLYNSWFLAILLGSYAALHRNQVKRLVTRARALLRTRTAASLVVAGATTLVLGLWVVVLGSIAAEQAGNYIRLTGAYRVRDAFVRVQEWRLYTTELFNPSLERALEWYPSLNPVHNSRYIGVVFLPLLALVPSLRWRRREQWLVLSSAGVLVVCMAPGVLLRLWEWTPFMSRILHLFYFYSHHWQLSLALLGGAALDRLLCRPDPTTRRRMVLALCLLSGGLVLLLMVYGLFAHLFAAGDAGLDGTLHAVVLALVCSVALLQVALYPRASRVCVAILVALTLGDLTRYFWIVSEHDRLFTGTERFAGLRPPIHPIPPAVREVLARPWSGPSREAGFAGDLFTNMPIPNHFWPQHYFTTHRFEQELLRAPELRAWFLEAPSLTWYPRAVAVSEPEAAAAVLTSLEGRGRPETRAALLQGAAAEQWWPGRASSPEPISEAFAYTLEAGGYNDFAFALMAPGDGWLVVRQLCDPLWTWRIDGRLVEPVRAEFAGMALPTTRGAHRLSMEYRPRARTLYPVATIALELLLLALFAAAAGASRSHPSRLGGRSPIE